MGVIAAAASTSHSSDWDPVSLVVGLLIFAVVSNELALPVRNITVTGAFSALILAMTLLGPGPSVLIGLVAMLVNAIQKRMPIRYALSSLFTWTAFPLIGSLAARSLAPSMEDEFAFSLLVLGTYLVSNLLNFVLIYGYLVVAEGRSWRAGVKDLLPVFPVEVATGLLVVGVVYFMMNVGLVAIAMVSVVVLIFQYMLRTALQAEERGQQLGERNRELASLQLGFISTMLKTLALRDHMTARHSAAVARYAREVAAELGLSEDEQELFHTAGLFHDIGKFIFPDSILLADTRLTDEQFAIVRKHPEVGADLIAEIDGYGPVSKIVRHHHERIDGRGYPDGLAGEEIPLASRILAVADVYDVITARDTYRKPVSTPEAFAELRRSAGSQLDAHLVETFINLVVKRGVGFRHSTAADFEAELGLERRVSDYAAPRKAA